MKKLLLLCLVVTSLLRAESTVIDERKVDLYYANGIMMQDDEKTSRNNWQTRVKFLMKSHPQLQAKLGEVDVAYNISNGLVADMWEAFMQKVDLEPSYDANWKAFKLLVSSVRYVGKAAELIIAANETASDMLQHDGTLNGQVSKYKESIKAGHGVVVVAHSQGNLFTLEAFKKIEASDAWMLRYFHTIAVATPAASIPNGGNGVTFYNDMINLVPTAMDNKIDNPNKHDYIEVTRNAVGDILDQELLTDQKSIQYHSFEYYLGYPVFEKALKEGSTSQISNEPRKTDNAKTIILAWLYDEIVDHFDNAKQPSQWEKSADIGCTCKDKAIYVKHKYDSNLSTLMQGLEVLPFDEKGKLYAEGFDYIKGSAEGNSVLNDFSSEVCRTLLDIEDKPTGQEISGPIAEPTPKAGAVEVFLSWDKPAIDLDLEVKWDAGSVDIKDTGCPKEHFYIHDEGKIFPGRYSINVNDKSDDSIKEMTTFPVTVTVKIATPGAGEQYIYKIKDKESLELVHVADIKVFREDKETDEDGQTVETITFSTEASPTCPPFIYTPSSTEPKKMYRTYYGGASLTYFGSGGFYANLTREGGISNAGSVVNSTCPGDVDCLPDVTDSSQGSDQGIGSSNLPSIAVGGEIRELREVPCEYSIESCGCTPCEYEIIAYLQQIYFGPLRDADFALYTLEGFRETTALYEGKSTNGDSLYTAGEIEIPKETMETLLDDQLYIIEAVGGEDIDFDDDYKIDLAPTPNLGKVYAVARGSELKYVGLKVNILTTMAYELVKDDIANGTQADLIAQKLDESAQELLRQKVYPDESSNSINNSDLLAWLPTVDKDILLRSYIPIEKMVGKIYLDEDIHDDVIAYLYGEDTNTSQVPVVKSLTIKIPEDLSQGRVVGKVDLLRGENVSFLPLSGKGAETFEIDSVTGEIKFVSQTPLDYETKWLYKLKVSASNQYGVSQESALFISIIDIDDAPTYLGFSGGSVDENATAGTLVAHIDFNDTKAPIDSYLFQGTSTDIFGMNNNGDIYLLKDNALDYESILQYGFIVYAHNSYGNSMPVIVHISVNDIADIAKVIDATGLIIHEDAVEGDLAATVQLQEGVELLEIYLSGPDSEHFTISENGEIRVAANAQFDYETKNYYNLFVHLRNSYGTTVKELTIEISDRDDAPSFASFEGGNILENSPIGTYVAKVTFNDNAAKVTSFHMRDLYGQVVEYLTIDKNGTITVAKSGLDFEATPAFEVNIIARNALGNSLPVKVKIYVDDVDETKATLQNTTIESLDENIAVGSLIGHINIDSNGSSDIYYFKVTGEGNETFNVTKDGAVYTTKALDFEQKSVYNLSVKARNEAGFSSSVSLNIFLNDVLDLVPSIHRNNLFNILYSVDEDKNSSYLIGSITLDVYGDSAFVGFNLSGEDSEKFSIDINGSLRLREGQVLDYESKTQYALELRAENLSGISQSVPLVIKVNNLADTKPQIEGFSVNIPENTANEPIGKIVVLLSDSDVDTQFTLSGNGSELFRSTENGIVFVEENASIDYESLDSSKMYVLSATFKNAAGISEAVDINISILNVDEPAVIAPVAFSVSENVLSLEKLADVTTLRAGDNPISYYSLNSDQFEVTPLGVLRVKAGVTLDYEVMSHYDLTLYAYTSSGQESTGVDVVVNVLNEVDNVILNDLTVNVDENSESNVSLGTVEVLELGDEPIRSFVLSGIDMSLFDITERGEVSFASGIRPDYEEREAYSFNVYALTDSNQSNTVSVNVKINNVLEKNIFNDFYASIKETTKAGTKIGTLLQSVVGDTISSMALEGMGHEAFKVDLEGNIYVVNDTLAYDSIGIYELKLIINHESDAQLHSNVTIELLDGNLRFSVGIGRWEGAHSDLFYIEDNGSKRLLFSDTASVDTNLSKTAKVNSHHLELDADGIYLYEVSEGIEADSNLDGVRDVTGVDNNGTLHAYVKGSWLFDNEQNLSINLMSEAFYQWISSETNVSDVAMLASKMDEVYTPVCKSDLSGNETQWKTRCNAEDALYYDAILTPNAWSYSSFDVSDLGFIREKTIMGSDEAVNYIRNSLYSTYTREPMHSSLSVDENSLYFFGNRSHLVYVDLDTNLSTQTPIDLLDNITQLYLSPDGSYLYTKKVLSCSEECDNLFEVYDVQSPSMLYARSSVSIGNTTLLNTSNDIVYLRDNNNGKHLRMLDINDKDDLNFLTASMEIPLGRIDDVHVIDETHILFANNKAGLAYVDTQDNSNIQVLDTLITDGHVNKIIASPDNKLYININKNGQFSLGEVDIVANKLVLQKITGFDHDTNTLVMTNSTTILMASQGIFYQYQRDASTGSWVKIKQVTHASGHGEIDMHLLPNSQHVLLINDYKVDVYDLDSLQLVESLEYTYAPG